MANHAYLLGAFNEFHRLGSFHRLPLAWRIFGRTRVDDEIRQVRAVLAGWGYQLGQDDDKLLPMVICQLFLLNRSPHVEDLATDLFDRVRTGQLFGSGARLNTLHAVQRAVVDLGFRRPPVLITGRTTSKAGGAPQVWTQWVERWHATSTLTPSTRGGVRSTLLKIGRWAVAEQSEAADPVAWTRQTCAALVAALDRMNVGDYTERTVGLKDRMGKPLEASTKASQLAAVRTFFRDCQEWEWLPPPVRPSTGPGHPAQHRGAARPRPARDR